MRIRYQVCVVFIDHCALNCIATRLSLDPISQLCQLQQPHTSIPSLASPIQLNCHRDVPNLSLHLTPTPEPQTSPPLSRSLPPPCPSHRSALYVANSLAGYIDPCLSSTLISSTSVPCSRSLPIPDLLQCYHLLPTLENETSK